MDEHRHEHGHGHDWDDRYGDEPMWSGRPNEALVREVTDLRPGTALDIGCGEGGDAVWLARQGWRVTGIDVSGRALERAARSADATRPPRLRQRQPLHRSQHHPNQRFLSAGYRDAQLMQRVAVQVGGICRHTFQPGR